MVGPRGPPGESFLSSLDDLEDVPSESLVARIKELRSFVGQKGEELSPLDVCSVYIHITLL